MPKIYDARTWSPIAAAVTLALLAGCASGSGSSAAGQVASIPSSGSASASGGQSSPTAAANHADIPGPILPDNASPGSGQGKRSADASPSASPSRPPVISTVERGEAVLTASLIDAIKRWQVAIGLPVTGSLRVGAVLVELGAVQISALQVQLGDSATGALMSVSPTTKEVTVNADASAVPSLRHAGPVVITLPDDSTTTGRVTSISSAVQSGANTSDGQPQQTLIVVLNRPAAAAGLQTASVRVAFPGPSRNGVLAVPVGALLIGMAAGVYPSIRASRLTPAEALAAP